MSILDDSQLQLPATIPPVPPLENGDRLDRREFERRYQAMPQLKKAELIQGRVNVASPVRIQHHGNPHFRAIGWLSLYETNTPGVIGGDNSTIRLGGDNEPQPDVCLLIHPSLGGQCGIDQEGYLVGAPELVLEVAASSVSYDLFDKHEVYARHGVKEYLVWRVDDRRFDWFVLRGNGMSYSRPPETGSTGARFCRASGLTGKRW